MIYIDFLLVNKGQSEVNYYNLLINNKLNKI